MVKRVLESSHGVIRKQDCGALCSGFVTSVGQRITVEPRNHGRSRCAARSRDPIFLVLIPRQHKSVKESSAHPV